MPDGGTLITLREEQETDNPDKGDVNYYVLVPFTTVGGALWAAGEIGAIFDCCVVSRAAVDQDAAVIKEAGPSA